MWSYYRCSFNVYWSLYNRCHFNVYWSLYNWSSRSLNNSFYNWSWSDSLNYRSRSYCLHNWSHRCYSFNYSWSGSRFPNRMSVDWSSLHILSNRC